MSRESANPGGDQRVSGDAQHFEMTIRLYSYPRDGRWFAEALDLALLAEGASEEEAMQCLLEQAVAYISTAVGHGWLDRLHRPASFRHRLSVSMRVRLAQLRRQPALVRNKLVQN